jgi:hypothetical protein
MPAINLIPLDRFCVRERCRCASVRLPSSANLYGRNSVRLLIVSHRRRRRAGQFGIWTKRESYSTESGYSRLGPTIDDLTYRAVQPLSHPGEGTAMQEPDRQVNFRRLASGRALRTNISRPVLPSTGSTNS